MFFIFLNSFRVVIGLLALLQVASALKYWNYPVDTLGGSTYYVLVLFAPTASLYDGVANTSMLGSIDEAIINPQGYYSLAKMHVEAAQQSKNNRHMNKEDMIIDYMQALLDRTSIDVDANEVLAVAEERTGSSGYLLSGGVSEKHPSWEDAETCLMEKGFHYDLKPASHRGPSRYFKWRDDEVYWNNTNSIVGASSSTSRDGFASKMVPWVKDGSSSLMASVVHNWSFQTKISGFVYARYDNTNTDNVWLIAGAPLTTIDDCDPIPSVEAIHKAIDKTLIDASKGNVASVCSSLYNDGIWHCDLRIMLSSLAVDCGLNVWDQPCTIDN
ncbi:hypothetical protein CANARDRAFT_123326 [[Candida] arabinofermentans NRRL YB-2248]|uniref:Uncharacterized protein n=1 Tax=[Candida] arabinofermentans NRRL YB-2248 TaxID=983967 RepID=A0A1E4SSV3_9ASCO|nr:hypothetical protein CANARDRAFT_123326 [[Candida] arabinofermentans NRRL YB-2248]